VNCMTCAVCHRQLRCVGVGTIYRVALEGSKTREKVF
jgi:hypothetical protein